MKTALRLVLCLLSVHGIRAQTQILVTNPEADSVLKGDFNPAKYRPAAGVAAIGDIIPDMLPRISRDSLEASLKQVVSFYNRNTGSDTLSDARGIGAARRWGFAKLQAASARNEGRLLVSYLQFTQSICTVTQHRCVLGVLPGSDVKNHAVVILEGHLDSRCEGVCDIACRAEGADDNAGAVALVLELARVFGKYGFARTLVFALTTGEEQGLDGAKALAQYCVTNKIPVLGVINNDVVGGVICGPTASPPGCTVPGSVDSTHVRIFSSAVNFSLNKGLGRFIKGQCDRWLTPRLEVPMGITLMDPVDRTGRSGDHEPFSNAGIPAIRFTEAFEFGNGTPTGGRQHTSGDVLGKDLNHDGTLDGSDSLYVDYAYLHRNALINAVGLASAALGPQAPEFDTATTAQGYIRVILRIPTSPAGAYKIAIRVTGNDFAAVWDLRDSTSFILPSTRAGTTYYLAVAAVDAVGGQSLYSQEIAVVAKSDGPPSAAGPRRMRGEPGLRMPPPRVFADRISWEVTGGGSPGVIAVLRICDARGHRAKEHAFRLNGPRTEITLSAGSLASGSYQAVLLVAGRIVARRSFRL